VRLRFTININHHFENYSTIIQWLEKENKNKILCIKQWRVGSIRCQVSLSQSLSVILMLSLHFRTNTTTSLSFYRYMFWVFGFTQPSSVTQNKERKTILTLSDWLCPYSLFQHQQWGATCQNSFITQLALIHQTPFRWDLSLWVCPCQCLIKFQLRRYNSPVLSGTNKNPSLNINWVFYIMLTPIICFSNEWWYPFTCRWEL